MSKSKLVRPHLAPIAAIVALGTKFDNQAVLQQLAGVTSVIPRMHLKPEHVLEFKTEIDKLMAPPFTGEYAKIATKCVLDATDKLITLNAAQDNGGGARHTGAAAPKPVKPGAKAEDRHPQ